MRRLFCPTDVAQSSESCERLSPTTLVAGPTSRRRRSCWFLNDFRREDAPASSGDLREGACKNAAADGLTTHSYSHNYSYNHNRSHRGTKKGNSRRRGMDLADGYSRKHGVQCGMDGLHCTVCRDTHRSALLQVPTPRPASKCNPATPQGHTICC